MKTESRAPTAGACGRVDAHLHQDTILYGDVMGRTVFYLEHHPNLVEYEAAQLKKLWESSREMAEALKAMLKAYEQLMPGLKNIAVQDYANLNEAPILARAALAKAGQL